jgi:hypothetical protein
MCDLYTHIYTHYTRMFDDYLLFVTYTIYITLY